MAFFIISIPLMLLAVVIAVLPLVVMSLADRHRAAETTTPALGLQVGPAMAEDEEVHQAA